MPGARHLLILLAFLLAAPAARATCVPSNATIGMIGCEPVASSVAGTDYVQVWLPGSFPNSAQIISVNNLFSGRGGSGSGTVTSLSVSSANGFGGSVTNPTTTPAITLSTSVSGLLIGNGTSVTAAIAGTDYISPAGGTLTGELITAASTIGSSGLNLPQGSAPTSPVNGDLWTTSSGLFVRINGGTVGPLGSGGGGGITVVGTPTSGQIAEWVTASSLEGVTATGTGSPVLATSPTLVTPALGTPTSGVATNLTGTAAGLTAGNANGLNSATTTIVVNGATAPTSGQVLTATGSTAASWQTPSGGGGLAVGTTTISGGTTGHIEYDNAGVLGELATTGSGNVVLATSPTLVTPALGTPSAIVLTNATGLPVTGITGLGTGVATALADAVNATGGFVTFSGALGTPTSGVLTNATGLPLTTGVTGILGGANGGTGINNGSNTITTSLNFAITGSGNQTFFFGNTGVPWTYNFPQVTANIAYQVGSLTSGHCAVISGTVGGIADSGNVGCGGGSGSPSLIVSSATANTSLGTLPANGFLGPTLLLWETSGVSATVSIGTTSGGNDVLSAQTVNASSSLTVPIATFTKGWFSASATQPLYLTTSGGGSTINAQLFYWVGGTSGGSGGGSGAFTITDGTHTVPGVTNLSVTGGVVGGTSPNATLTATAGCTVSGGAQYQILVNSGSSSCSSSANGSVQGGALTLGASGTVGSVAMGNATSGTITLQPTTGALGSVTATLPANTGVLAELNLAATWTGAQTFTNGDLLLKGSSSGAMTLEAPAVASSFVMTFPAATDTVDVLGTAQTFVAAKTFTNSDLLLLGSSTGVTTFASANASATNYTVTFPAATANMNYLIGSATNGHCVEFSGTAGGVADTGSACGSGSGGLTVGTTTITSGTSGRIEYDNAGVLGELATTGSGNVVLVTSPTLVTPALGTPSALVLTNATGLPISGITGLGTGVATALADATNATGGFVTFSGALGTPTSGIATNLTGTAAGLTAGAANGLNSATTTIVVNGATAPTSGQVLTATGGTAASWQTPSGGGSFANPTATAGPTAVNGSASTAMRSDAAPAVQVGSASQEGILEVDGQTIVATTGVISTTSADHTFTANHTIAATDMGGQANFNGSSLTVTIPSISSTVLASGMSVVITNTNSSALTISTTPTINGFTGTSIPQNGGIACTSNGTSLDCIGMGVLANHAFLNAAQTWTAAQTFAAVQGGVNVQSGTTYTTVATDCGKTLLFTNASAVTVTIAASIVPASGTACILGVIQGGASKVSVNGSAVSAASLVSANSYTGTSGTAGAVIDLVLTTVSSTATAYLTGNGS